MITWLTRGSQVDSCDSTVQISRTSRGCFTSYMIVWDPGDFITYAQVQEILIGRDVADVALGHMGKSLPLRQSALVDQLLVMNDIVATVISLLYFWDASRGEVETYSKRRDIPSFQIHRIEAVSGFADLGFMEIPLQDMIHDSKFSPYRYFSVGF
jgi:hypothetical protein